MKRNDVTLTGILAAVSTPFTDGGVAIDEVAIASLVDRLIAGGVNGIVPTGTTGEFTSLTADEFRQVVGSFVSAADGRVPVVAGIGSCSTATAVELAVQAEGLGADALMVVPPFYDPLSFEELVAFLRTVAAATSLRIVYYNVPGATGIRLDAERIAALGDIDGVDYLKDTSGDAVTMAELLAHRSDRIKAFNGWDTLTFFGIASGAEASVWGVASIAPREAAALWQALAVDGDLARARELWAPLWELSSFLESVNYASGIKTAQELIGAPVGPVRAPLLPLSADDRATLEAILVRMGLAPAAVAA